MQPLQICIGPIIRIGRESWCLPYAGFLNTVLLKIGLLVILTFLRSKLDRKLHLNLTLYMSGLKKTLLYAVWAQLSVFKAQI